jgi:cell division protein FtsQ
MSRREAAAAGKEKLRLAGLIALRKVLAPVLAAALTATAVISGCLLLEDYLLQSPSFVVRTRTELGGATDVVVRGVSTKHAQQVIGVFDADHGRSLYLLPLEERRSQLLAIPWVKEASVSRYWPRSIEVRVQEREPVAFAHLPPRRPNGPARVMLIDEDGVLLEPAGRTRQDLPVLTGVRLDQSPQERAHRVRRMRQLLEEAGNLASEISVIDALDPENLKITMRVEDKLLVLILGPEGYARRLERFLRHYPEIRHRVLSGAVIDLRIEDRATVVREGRPEGDDAR